MLLADVALLAAVWLDARHASPLGERGSTVTREAPPAFSVGRSGEVSSRGTTRPRGPARLRLREVRPELLGGTQPPREITVPPQGDVRETVAVVPVRRGRERAGAVVVGSTGPPRLGRRRSALARPRDAARHPPPLPLPPRAAAAGGPRRRP